MHLPSQVCLLPASAGLHAPTATPFSPQYRSESGRPGRHPPGRPQGCDRRSLLPPRRPGLLTWKYWFSCTRLSLDRILLMVIRLLLIPPRPAGVRGQGMVYVQPGAPLCQDSRLLGCLSGRGRWSRDRQERGRAARAVAPFPRAGRVTGAREAGGRCLTLSLPRGRGGTGGLLPRTSSGPGEGGRSSDTLLLQARLTPGPRAMLGLHLPPVPSRWPVWLLTGDPQR